jgi:hypothetical protein
MHATRGVTIITIVLCAVSAWGQQKQKQDDTKSRVYVEAGPPSEFFSDADLQSYRNSFGESFPNFCPKAVITEDRRKASYVIRLGMSVVTDALDPAKDKLLYDMAVLRKDGDQVFSDFATSTVGKPAEEAGDIRNPEIRFTREACVVIAYQVDSDTVSMITRQAERRQPRVYVSTKYEGNDSKGPQARAFASVFGYAFSEVCFCVVRTEVASEADYVLQFDMPKSKQDTLTVLDRSEERIFSKGAANRAQASELLTGACQAILHREVRAREK